MVLGKRCFNTAYLKLDDNAVFSSGNKTNLVNDYVAPIQTFINCTVCFHSEYKNGLSPLYDFLKYGCTKPYEQ